MASQVSNGVHPQQGKYPPQYLPVGKWYELDVDLPFPEGDFKQVRCNKCGGKNRRDDGWRYCNDPQHAAAQHMQLASLGMRSSIFGLSGSRAMEVLGSMMGGLGMLRYECEYCRADRAHRHGNDDDDDDDDDEEEEEEEEEEDDKDEMQQNISPANTMRDGAADFKPLQKSAATEKPVPAKKAAAPKVSKATATKARMVGKPNATKKAYSARKPAKKAAATEKPANAKKAAAPKVRKTTATKARVANAAKKADSALKPAKKSAATEKPANAKKIAAPKVRKTTATKARVVGKLNAAKKAKSAK